MQWNNKTEARKNIAQRPLHARRPLAFRRQGVASTGTTAVLTNWIQSEAAVFVFVRCVRSRHYDRSTAGRSIDSQSDTFLETSSLAEMHCNERKRPVMQSLALKPEPDAHLTTTLYNDGVWPVAGQLADSDTSLYALTDVLQKRTTPNSRRYLHQFLTDSLKFFR